jgi:hypothetical protein
MKPRLQRWGKAIPRFIWIILAVILLGMAVAQLPPIKSRLSWRLETARAYLRGVLDPVEDLPAPEVTVDTMQRIPSGVPTAQPIPEFQTPKPLLPTPTLLPVSVQLPPPPYEKQDMNNCGPATLSMFLNMYGWEGDQYAISDVIKPIPQDRNVNVDELLYFTRNYVGWLRTNFRVGGTVDLLRQFIAAGYPVVIEEGFLMEEMFWPNDDLWAGHYLLLTGYDDTAGTFLTQDSFLGENKVVSYTDLDRTWQTFNRVFFFAYPPDQEAEVQRLLGEDWDEAANRRRALETARAETRTSPGNAFAWFNLGSNLVYFEDYPAAVEVYDRARQLGLPQRMLRYQFGPFFAYFHTLRNQDLLTLAEYALKITPNSEEALLWYAWGLYRDGRRQEALDRLAEALEARPGYPDAIYARDFILQN